MGYSKAERAVSRSTVWLSVDQKDMKAKEAIEREKLVTKHKARRTYSAQENTFI